MKNLLPDKNAPVQPKRWYQKPRIIYADTLKTRAGSPLGGPESDPANPFDPANLFGSD